MSDTARYTVGQEVKSLLLDLEPEEATRILIDHLRDLGNAVTVYGRDDVIGQIDEYHPEHTLSEDETSSIADVVQESYGWRTVLQQAREDDWDTINGEIQTAAHNLGLTLRLEGL